MDKSDLDKDSLKIGDYITLKDTIFNCFLAVEGILNDDVGGREIISSIHDATFCVHLQRQYSASRELHSFLQKHGNDPRSITDENELSYLRALERGKDNENSLNDTYMKKKMGQVVLFGDVVQLLHVKSGKYLQILPSVLAKDERDNYRIGLDGDGDAYSWIQVCPRFKIDKEGDRILSNAEVYLKVFARNNEYIHTALRDPIPGHFREINCSLELSSWRMSIYQSSTDTMQTSLLLVGQLMYINDPETKSYLSIERAANASLQSMSAESNDGKVETEEPPAETDGDIVEVVDDVVLVPASADNLDSNFLWTMEGNSFFSGGSIKWKTEQIRLRHFNTGKYLILDNQIMVDEDGNETESLVMQCTDERQTNEALFSIMEVNSTFKYLRNNKAMQLSLGGKWVTRGEVRSGATLSFSLTGGKEKEQAVSLMFSRFNPVQSKGKVVAKEDNGEEDEAESGEGDDAKSSREPFDVFVGLSARDYLQKYFDMTVIMEGNTANTLWPSAGRSDVETFKNVVEKIVSFVRGFSVSNTNIVEGVDKADPKIQKFRQNLVRQQGTLELLIRFIDKLLPLFENVDTGKSKRSLDNSLLLKMAQMVQSKCFAILYYVITENPVNQMYVADYMPILLKSLQTQELAVKCVTEMLSKNQELQETKIGTREIQIFVDKLRSSQGNTMYLQLLQACCSCEGNGVDGNQCKVAKLLFEDVNDIYIQVSADYGFSHHVDWDREERVLYLNPPPSEEASILGENLLSRGLPKLTLSWVSKNRTKDPYIGSVEEVFDPIFSRSQHQKDNLLASAKSMPSVSKYSVRNGEERLSRQIVQQYFLAELFLSAEMCMDRNYLAMHQLDKYFPYEVLVTMMKMNVSNNLKGAAVRLLMCLHIDRDPQAGTKIPCLTRSWSDIKKHPEPQLPYVESHRRYQFGIIQYMISEHLRDMANSHWDELSRHMLKMLLTLVRFNFYGTNERMQDIMIPLIAVLDRRQVLFENKSNISKSTRSMAQKSFKDRSKMSSKLPSTSTFIAGIPEESEIDDDNKDYEGEEDLYDEAASLSTFAAARRSKKQRISRQRFKYYLQLLESNHMNAMVLFIVVLALALDVVLMTTGASFSPYGILWIIEVAFFGLFASELVARAYCSIFVLSSWYAIVLDPINAVDFVAVAANILFFFLLLDPVNQGLTFVKALRLIRLLRFASLLTRSAKVDIVADEQEELEGVAQLPARYSRAPILELETMVEAMDVLAFMQKLIEDRNLSLFLRYFYLYETNADRRNPAQLFMQVLEDSKALSLSVDDFEHVMLDNLMFVHPQLVQRVLEVMMAHYSMHAKILENARNAQLLASSKREKQFRQVEKMLQALEQNAETHELWGELETDADKQTNEETKKILSALTELSRVRRTVLEFDQDYAPDVEIQNLYRNLGCFEICLKVLGLLESVEEEEDGSLSEVALNTRDLCRACNNLLYWFLLDNAENQAFGFEELDLFLKSLDDEINSHLVIQAIFHNNEALMRAVPHSHLSDLVNRIAQDNKSHHYLALFGAIAYVEEKTIVEGKVEIEQKNIVENQLEIVKTLTSPGRLQQVSCFFVPVTHPDYDLKRELMKPYLDREDDLSLDDLPPLLAYHLMFLEVLSGCTVGRSNITTVEAKVQSVFNYVDILQSILDPGSIIVCKIRLSRFFYNSIIETDLRISGLEQSASIWKLLQTYPSVLGYAKDEVRRVEKLGWESREVSRQKIEYIMICIMIAGGFFDRYYDPTTFRFSDGSSSSGNSDKVHITLGQVNELINSLCTKIKDLYDLDSPRLSVELKASIFNTMLILNRKASKVIFSNLVPNTSATIASKDVISAEGKLLEKYHGFIDEIRADPRVITDLKTEQENFIDLLESLPKVADKTVVADIRFETLIRKLVSHITGSLTISETKKFLDPSTTKTSTWIITSFRTMLEKKMQMTIFERDEDGGLEEDEAAAPVIDALCNCGVVNLCLDLIADGIDSALQLEAIRLGIALLFKEGGALRVQMLMHEHLSKTNSESFFLEVRLILQKLRAWHDWRKIIILPEGEDPSPPEEIWMIRFLQLMCEGHFKPNQDIMREQPNNAYSYNLLDDFVNYLNCLSRIPCRTSTVASIRVANTILEVIQGPCENNQAHFTLNTEIIETLNRINRAKVIHDCVGEEETELKKISVDIFQGLLEGQGEKSPIYERVLSVIHLDIIQMMSKGVSTAASSSSTSSETVLEDADMSEDEIALRTESVILLQMLCNYKPSLYEELGISSNIEDIVGSGTAMIEVVWRGDIHRRFFHIPKVSDYLAKTSKDNLVENVDRTNAENKLIDFLKRSQELYREVKHQEFLTAINLSRVFSRENQNRATWITFTLSIIINFLFICYYVDNSEGNPEVRARVPLGVINAFNGIQLGVAAFVLVQNLVVRSPVIFQGHLAAGHSAFNAIVYTSMDGWTMYFTLYLILSFFGLFLADYYLPFLLLDIAAKNATTRDILNAVVLPRKQLMMTVVLAVFVNYIYAYYYFLFFRKNLGGIYGIGVDPGDRDCRTLWGCFKFVLCYGLRQGGGVGDVMNLSIGGQWIADTTYFLVVIIMLLNIVFGIIIDTFSSLRAAKLERMEDTTEICFICGIDKQVFDRASSEPDGFQTHISVDHNMWNYLHYIFMLWEQDRDDDDGLEQFVRRAIEKDEIVWFPMNKAKRLDQAASEEEQTVEILQQHIRGYEENVTKRLQAFQAEVNVILDHISSATRQEYEHGDAKNGIARYLHQRAQELVFQQLEDTADVAPDVAVPTAVALDGDSDDVSLLDEEGSLGGLVQRFDDPWNEGNNDDDDEAGDEDSEQDGMQLKLPDSVIHAQSQKKTRDEGNLMSLDDNSMDSSDALGFPSKDGSPASFKRASSKNNSPMRSSQPMLQPFSDAPLERISELISASQDDVDFIDEPARVTVVLEPVETPELNLVEEVVGVHKVIDASSTKLVEDTAVQVVDSERIVDDSSVKLLQEDRSRSERRNQLATNATLSSDADTSLVSPVTHAPKVSLVDENQDQLSAHDTLEEDTAVNRDESHADIQPVKAVESSAEVEAPPESQAVVEIPSIEKDVVEAVVLAPALDESSRPAVPGVDTVLNVSNEDRVATLNEMMGTTNAEVPLEESASTLEMQAPSIEEPEGVVDVLLQDVEEENELPKPNAGEPLVDMETPILGTIEEATGGLALRDDEPTPMIDRSVDEPSLVVTEPERGGEEQTLNLEQLPQGEQAPVDEESTTGEGEGTADTTNDATAASTASTTINATHTTESSETSPAQGESSESVVAESTAATSDAHESSSAESTAQEVTPAPVSTPPTPTQSASRNRTPNKPATLAIPHYLSPSLMDNTTTAVSPSLNSPAHRRLAAASRSSDEGDNSMDDVGKIRPLSPEFRRSASSRSYRSPLVVPVTIPEADEPEPEVKEGKDDRK